MSQLILPLLGAVGLIIGLVVGYFLRKKIAQAQANSIEAKAEKNLKRGQNQTARIYFAGQRKKLCKS